MSILPALLGLMGPGFFDLGIQSRPLAERDKAKRSPEMVDALKKAAEEKRMRKAAKRSKP